MKKTIITLLAIIGLASVASAQWVSPGNGTTYTMESLVAASDGAVTSTGNNTYSINSDITISTGDSWTITSDVAEISAGEVNIEVNGTMTAEGTDSDKISFVGSGVGFTLRFDEATADIRGVEFAEGSSVRVVSSIATFRQCEFRNFKYGSSSTAVSLHESNPEFVECLFVDNEAAAISSGINIQCSPRIENCTFTNNVTSNQNYPQINLGPGADNDTIYILNNTITGGGYSMSGGVVVADLMGTGSTKVRLEGNTITNNRYGYNQQGMTISSVIRYNHFIDNDAETTPANGGSGISIYGTSNNCKAIIRHNTIKGNLWGITAIYMNDIDLGTENDWGHNNIYDNFNSGMEFDLYNYSLSDIQAIGNYWGTTNPDEIANRIYDHNDDATVGTVTYEPFLEQDGIDENLSFEMTIAPNPVSDILTITFEKELSAEMSIYNMAGQLVASQRIENKANRINVSNLESGIYTVVINGSGITKAEKIVVGR